MNASDLYTIMMFVLLSLNGFVIRWHPDLQQLDGI